MIKVAKPSIEKAASIIGVTFQHILIALPAILAVPVLFGAIVGLNQMEMLRMTQASILISGLMTILHSIKFKGLGSNAPMVIGSDMIVVAIGIRAASQMNLRTFFLMIAIGAIFSWGLSYFLPKRIKAISPSVIISTMMIYCISFLPVTLDWFLGGVGSPDYGSMRSILVGAATFIFTLFLNQYGRGMLKFGSIGIGMIFGFSISLPMGLIKWSESGSTWFSVPEIMPYVPTINWNTVVMVIPIIVVLLVKQLMDLFVYSKQNELSNEEQTVLIHNGMQSNAIGYLLSFFLGGVPTSAQTQNFGINSFLQTESKRSIIFAGFILMIVGLMPKLSSLFVFIPLPVLGAMGLLLMTSLFNMSIQGAKHITWTNKSLMVFSLSFIFGLLALFKPGMGFAFGQGIKVIIESAICVTFFTGLFLEFVIPDN